MTWKVNAGSLLQPNFFIDFELTKLWVLPLSMSIIPIRAPHHELALSVVLVLLQVRGVIFLELFLPCPQSPADCFLFWFL